ncbi:hypothetical protein [Kurthia sp. Dielmo]|uniref:hypothetical protein n=1 Tax=Kurthia sp. Dielmo TaxID=1033738 RepID=UPI00111DE22B|nr:hypothetical protein [Kurthia sp. Dielmo]
MPSTTLVLPVDSINVEDGFTKWLPSSKAGSRLTKQQTYLQNVVGHNVRSILNEDIAPSTFKRIVPFVIFVNSQLQMFVIRNISNGSYHLGNAWYMHEKERDLFQLVQHTSHLIGNDREENEFSFEGTVRSISERNSDIGFVFSIITDDVSLPTSDYIEGEWLNVYEAARYYSHFDAFSQLVLDHLYVEAKKRNGVATPL